MTASKWLLWAVRLGQKRPSVVNRVVRGFAKDANGVSHAIFSDHHLCFRLWAACPPLPLPLAGLLPLANDDRCLLRTSHSSALFFYVKRKTCIFLFCIPKSIKNMPAEGREARQFVYAARIQTRAQGWPLASPDPPWWAARKPPYPFGGGRDGGIREVIYD